jgi:hypothetical protein
MRQAGGNCGEVTRSIVARPGPDPRPPGIRPGAQAKAVVLDFE